METASLRIPTYESLGVRPLINCKGTYTIISGSLMLPEVREAMMLAATRYVDLDELMEAVGKRLGELMGAEWGLVTCGCAAALCQVTAACVAGDDPSRIARLPDTTGMKNEVVVQRSHRHVYDHAIRMVGVRLREVETMDELARALSEKTAMFAFFGDAADRGRISLAEMAEVGKKHGIPTFVDAAAERPDVPNRYLSEGADAVAYSGGKCLRGPQATGLVLGRKDLLKAAFLNGAPHHSLGRPMKVGKEEIMGLLTAVEMWVRRDHQAEWREWERRLDYIAQRLRSIPSLKTSVRLPGRSNVAPVLEVVWDVQVLGITGERVRRLLSEGEPRIELFASESGVSVVPSMMEPEEEILVAERLWEVLVSLGDHSLRRTPIRVG